MDIEQVIFDCDGVLVDSEIVAAEVVVKELNRLGVSIDVPFYLRNYSGKTFRDILKILNFKLPYPLEEFIHNAERQVYENVRPIEGIQHVLDHIELPKAVVSNSDLPQVKISIETIGIAHHFQDNCFSASMVTTPKPSPMVYQLAAKKLKKNPAQCLVVEDSKSGVTAAVAADMNVIGFCGGSHILPGHDVELKKLGAKKIAMNTAELGAIIATMT